MATNKLARARSRGSKTWNAQHQRDRALRAIRWTNAECIALDLLACAEKLSKAQNDFLSYRSEGGPEADGLELLGKLWSVSECLKGFATSVRKLGGEP